MDLVLIDGPNLFNAMGRRLARALSNVEDAELLRSYFVKWFQIDRLVNSALALSADSGPTLGTIIFRSRRSLGREQYRLDQNQTEEFWGRQATLTYVSEVLVEIPGKQSEGFECSRCGHTVSQERREKGVDASMICYLFETLEAWQRVCLFTDDADFVPPVQALRRKGKAVFCSFDESHADPLPRAAQSFLPWPVLGLECDLAWFQMFRTDGLLDEAIRESNGDFRCWLISAERQLSIILYRPSNNVNGLTEIADGFQSRLGYAGATTWSGKFQRVASGRQLETVRVGLELGLVMQSTEGLRRHSTHRERSLAKVAFCECISKCEDPPSRRCDRLSRPRRPKKMRVSVALSRASWRSWPPYYSSLNSAVASVRLVIREDRGGEPKVAFRAPSDDRSLDRFTGSVDHDR